MWRRRQSAPSRPDLDPNVWSLPLWWRRRVDPSSPAYDPVGPDGVNTVDRRWTLLGTLDGAGRGAVDPRGTLWTGGSFTIEWWVRANDRWYLAPHVAAVRQVAVDGTPVIETRMRAAGGDVVQRVGAVAGGAGHVRVEVANETDAAVALALAIRPFDLAGASRIEHIELVDGWVVVDGVQALQLSRTPGLALGGTADADLAVLLDGPDADGRGVPSLPVRCDRGAAHAVVSVPVVHGTSIEAVAPLLGHGDVDVLDVAATPPLDRVAAGWVAQTRDETRVELPEDGWNQALDLLRRSLVLFAGPDGAMARPMTGEGPAASDHLVTEALDRLGRHRDAASALLAIRDHADRHGALGDLANTVAAMRALDRHTALSGVTATAEACAETIVGAARHLAKVADGGEGDGELADVGLRHIAALLEVIGQADAAADVAGRSGASTQPHDPVSPEGVPVHRNTPPMGFDVVATADAAVIDLRAGRPGALERVDWLVEATSATGSVPAVLHPAGGGVGGDGHDGAAVASIISALLSTAVVEHPGEARLSLLPAFRESWLGAPVEAHRVPTRWGIVSFAIRWHGERPALLWEIDRPADGLVVDCPGVDPDWSTTESVGETLLAAPQVSAQDTEPNEERGDAGRASVDEASSSLSTPVEITIDLDSSDGGFS